MGCAWKHPSLGPFEHKHSGFVTTLTIPAFKKFSYDTGYSNAPRSTGKFNLRFEPWLMNETLAEPTGEMVQLAEKVLADPDKLVDAVAQALWEDFNGRGPTTGMWWYGGMDQVSQCFADKGLSPPAKPQDILPALQLTDLDVFNHLWEYPHAAAVLSFRAAFEEEHGLCIVTDGEKVLGTGYLGEPEIGKLPDDARR
jgi:hypothetical protein